VVAVTRAAVAFAAILATAVVGPASPRSPIGADREPPATSGAAGPTVSSADGTFAARLVVPPEGVMSGGPFTLAVADDEDAGEGGACACVGDETVFPDGFESGDMSAWSAVVGG
jgi:hypothetical protein